MQHITTLLVKTGRYVGHIYQGFFSYLLNHYRLKPKGCQLCWKRGKKLKLLQSYARYIVRLMCIRIFIDVLINNFICDMSMGAYLLR
jgi:hypothetical protein